MSNRDLFSELSSALVEAKEHSEGKLTLKTHQVSETSDLDISPDEIVNIREQFNMFAVYSLVYFIHHQERLKTGNKDVAHLMDKQ